MEIKFKPIIITWILICSTIFLGLSAQIIANEPDNDLNAPSALGNNFTRGTVDINWSQLEVISEPVFGQNYNQLACSDAKIAVEGDKIYVVWHDETELDNSGLDNDIFYRYFDGYEWSEIQVISEPVKGQNINIGHSYEPAIAVENGNIYVTWSDYNDTDFSSTDIDIFYRCNITGSNWEDIQVISEPMFGFNLNTGHSFDNDIVVENNDIFVIWRDYTNLDNSGSDTDIFYRCNLTGSSWEDIQVISEPVFGLNQNTGWSYEPELVVENGDIYVAWHDSSNLNNAGSDWDILLRCNITGSDWEDIFIVSEPVEGQNQNTGSSSDPSFVIENNNFYIVWHDTSNVDNAGTDYDIFYRCNLTGSGWEAVQVISEPLVNSNINIGTSRYSDIAIYNNDIYVVWTDNNDTNNANASEYDIFFLCNFSGSGWSDVQVISEPILGQNLNDGDSLHPAITVSSNKTYVVWEDELNINGAGSDVDVFFRYTSLPLDLNFPTVKPTVGNTSTNFNFTVTYMHTKNTAPQELKVNINGMNYTMNETDPGDTNYIDGKDYHYVTNLDIGTAHSYRFWVADGDYTISTKLFDGPDVVNTPPQIITIDNPTAYENTYYEVVYNYEDIDLLNVGQISTWYFSTDANWLIFNKATTILYGTPTSNDIGNCWVNISVNDTIDLDFTNFTLTVIEMNDDPVITTNNVEFSYEDELYEVDYDATDADNPIGDLVWALTTNASAWLDIDAEDGILGGTPTNDEVGNYWVNVSVSDGDGGLDSENFTLTVINVNDPPRIITEDILVANIGELYEVDYDAIDIDSPPSSQTWQLQTDANWLEMGSTTGILSGTPLIEDVDQYSVNITVDDGDDGRGWREFELTVWGSGPPKILTIDVVTATVNKLYRVDYEAHDDKTPSDELRWELITNASWLKIVTDTGVISGTPAKNDGGWFWVNISVTDGEGGFDYHDFILTVYLTSNKPPKIVTEDKLFAEADELYSVEYNAIDDRTPSGYLQWFMQTNASWLKMDTHTRVLTGTPLDGDLGSYWVEVSVTDGENGWAKNNFTLKVVKEAQYGDDDFKLSGPKMTPTEGDTDTEYTFSIHYYNAENKEPDSIQLIIDGNIHNLELVAGEVGYNGIYECRIKLSKGEHTYYYTTTVGPETVNTEEFNTPEVKEVGNSGTTEGSAGWEWMFLIVILVIIIVLIIIDVMLRLKKQPEEPQPTPPIPTPQAPPHPQMATVMEPASAIGPQETPSWAFVPPTISEKLQKSASQSPSTTPVMPQVVTPAGFLPPQPRIIRPPVQPAEKEDELELEE